MFVDTTPPAITLLTRPPPFVSPSTPFPSLAFLSNKMVSFQCRLDTDPRYITAKARAQAVASSGDCVSPVEMPTLPDGAYRWTLSARDWAGNEGVPVEAPFIVDSTPPRITLKGPSLAFQKPTDALGTGTGAESGLANLTASFSVSDGPQGSGVAFTLCSLAPPDWPLGSPQQGGGDWTPCQSPVVYQGLTAGEYLFRVTAADRAGNWVDAPEFQQVTVKVTDLVNSLPKVGAPITVGFLGPFPRTVSSKSEVQFLFAQTSGPSGSDLAVSTQGSLPSTARGATLSSTLPVPSTAPLNLSAASAALGLGPAYTTDRPFGDAPSPSAHSQHSPATESANSGHAPASASSPAPPQTLLNPDVLGFECSLVSAQGGSQSGGRAPESATWQACSSPVAYSSLTDGRYGFLVRALGLDGTPGAVTSFLFSVGERTTLSCLSHTFCWCKHSLHPHTSASAALRLCAL